MDTKEKELRNLKKKITKLEKEVKAIAPTINEKSVIKKTKRLRGIKS